MNGAVGTVISIKAHHIAVQFDNVPEAYQVEKVKSRFVVMKDLCFQEAVSTDPGICSHNTQVPGSVTGLWYDGTVRSGVQSWYGVCCIIPCKTA